MRPIIKDVVWDRVGDDVRLVYDRRDHFLLNDPGGTVERLLRLLRDGGRTVPELAEALSVPGEVISAKDVVAALEVLDECRLVEDGSRLGRLDASAAERYQSNLAFFASFATLARSREDLHLSLRDAHVLVLGTGGFNSSTVQHLCGLGVGRLTLVDRDTVEAPNFARQYLYRWSDLGASKVERAGAWVRAYAPEVEVESIELSVDDLDDVEQLLDETRPTFVLSGMDSPREISEWVNSACVSRGIPYVRGGVFVSQGIVYSVDPGRSACQACGSAQLAALAAGEAANEAAAMELFRTKARANPAIGPVTGLLGSLAAFEMLRYLTAFEPPAYAGAPLIVDFAANCSTTSMSWRRDPDCRACSGR